MKPEAKSRTMLAITRSKAKMYEYSLPESDHIVISRDPAHLLRLAVGILGDYAAEISRHGMLDSAQLKARASELLFAARYFDSYAASRLAPARDAYLQVLAAAAYYLCDLPGSAAVLASGFEPNFADMDAGGLECLLWWLLGNQFSSPVQVGESPKYRDEIERVAEKVTAFFKLDAPEDSVLRAAIELRGTAYSEGTPRDLLFADACCAVTHCRVKNSARRSLPEYSGLSLDKWEPVLRNASFVTELWPAQRLLGERRVFAGDSAVIQMPTSAGKSRATEIIIRSAFLSLRASLAVVVAPFRALCHEIRAGLAQSFRHESVRVNEMSDLFQRDFDIADITQGQAILVVTPEKLAYALRHTPELAKKVGLIVFDEGHQFDVGTRGVTYELLVTSLEDMIPASAQKVLISAVMTNASEIAKWLIGDEHAVVSGAHLLPTERSVAFASWKADMGQLQFVEPEDPDRDEFFVPRVIKAVNLSRRARERSDRVFPVKDDSQSIALYLALRLVAKGAVAIFCGRKDTASKICELLVDIVNRGIGIQMPYEASNPQETSRITFLYEQNLGAAAAVTQAARLGAFTHHGNTPHGIRLAVEYAMKESLGKLVICTSTLAQGVNLPIRYLLVTTARQGGEKIKVRDFHNLMGRAGRSGMHTEGSVLFADPEVYDTRKQPTSRWREFKNLLRAENSEPCASSLLSVLKPLASDGGQYPLSVDPLQIVRTYVADQAGDGSWIADEAKRLSNRWASADSIHLQLVQRRGILVAIESFLLAHWREGSTLENQRGSSESAAELAKRTLAYFLATESQRTQLIELFELLAKNVEERASDPEKRVVYGRTLFGAGDSVALERWVAENREQILQCKTDDELFVVLWPCVQKRIRNNTFRRWMPADAASTLAKGWIAGDSFEAIHERMRQLGVRIGDGKRPRKPTIENVVEMGENALGFDGAHVLGAVVDLFESAYQVDVEAVAMLKRLQKRVRYGLASTPSILLYEAGFADRCLAKELAVLFPSLLSRSDVRHTIRVGKIAAASALERYPAYYHKVFEQVVN